MIKNIIYKGSWSPEDTFFRVLLFKIFNRIDTWKRFEEELGSPTWKSYKFGNYEKVLARSLSKGERLYSPAYIMPSPKMTNSPRKHVNHLRLIELMMSDRATAAIARARRMSEVFERLRSYPGIGAFLAYQYTIDLNYSELTDFSENGFVVPGPGARDGLRKCFPNSSPSTDADTIKMLQELHVEEFARLQLPVTTLWGRSLQLIDCQNLLCEVGKYARMSHPEVKGESKRTRIKQVYLNGSPLEDPWFPPKWGLNETIRTWLDNDCV